MTIISQDADLIENVASSVDKHMIFLTGKSNYGSLAYPWEIRLLYVSDTLRSAATARYLFLDPLLAG